MSGALARQEQQTPISVSNTPLVLSDIYQPGINFAIWDRALGAELQQDVDRLMLQKQLFSFRVILRPEEVSEWLTAQWPGSHLDAFQDDVQQLVTMFADLFDLTHVGMRLECVDKTLCPLFHIDKVMARMVTTYHGPATEWLTEDNINRQALKLRDHDRVMRDKSLLQSATAGNVLLFKGEEWPQENVRGVVHRSAQATADNRRLLLTLDLV